MITIDTTTPVLVLGAQTYGSLGIFRSLGRLGVTVDAVDVVRERPASRSRYLRRRIVADLAAQTPSAAVERLLTIGAGYRQPPILIPTSDDLAILVARHADRLRPAYVLPEQPPDLPAILADKKQMAALAHEHRVPTPSVVYPSSVDDVEAFAAAGAFPVMLKGIDGQLLKERTGLKMVIVERPDELVDLYRRLEDPDRPNLMLQEYIPGGDDTIWMFNGYFDRAGRCLVGYTGRKIRQTPAYVGVTSLGVCERNDVVRDLTTRWMGEIGYRGILDIGYRFDARDGTYRVLDANPRIGATFRLFVDGNGVDVVRALYLDLTGQPVVAGEPRQGRKWIVEGGDFDSFLTYRRDGKLGVGGWMRSMRGIEESAHFARDDPRPFLAVALGKVRRISPW